MFNIVFIKINGDTDLIEISVFCFLVMCDLLVVFSFQRSKTPFILIGTPVLRMEAPYLFETLLNSVQDYTLLTWTLTIV